MLWRGLLWIGFVCCLMPRLAAADFSVPSPLVPWQEWSLRNHSDIQCPFLYSTFERRQCQWPGTLQLRVTEGGLQFEQQWQLFAKGLSLIHISEPTRPLYISYAVFCLKKNPQTSHLDAHPRPTVR